jgi:beta-1,4-N-acetylglucosaminyltransferase
VKVFVAVGTGKFDELIKAVDALDVEAICQIGQGAYTPKNHRWFRMKPSLDALYRWADVIIAHAGGGTLFEVLPLGKKVIAVPNQHRTDRHQYELLNELSRRNVLIPCRTVRDLPRTITAARKIRLDAYVPERCNVDNVIHTFLETQ